MPIIHEPEEARCRTEPPYSGQYGNFSSAFGKYRSSSPVGTIWQCPDCERYLFTSISGGTRLWHWVEWYHFSVKRIIRRIEREGDVS